MNEPIRLVVVDDEPYVRKKIRGFLLEERGYRIVGEADNGVAALELAKRVRPDIVIADIGMPVMNGLELLRRLRELPSPPEVLMLTCYDQFEKAQAALRYGAADYVTKLLFKAADFAESLDRVAGKAREAAALRRQAAKERLSVCAAGSPAAPAAIERLSAEMPLGAAVVAVLRASRASAAWAAAQADRPPAAGEGDAAIAFRLDRDAWAFVYYRSARGMRGALAADVAAAWDALFREAPQAFKARLLLTDELRDWREFGEAVRRAHAEADDGLFLPFNAALRLSALPSSAAPLPSPPSEERLARLPRAEAAALLRRWMRSLPGEGGAAAAAWPAARAALPRLLCAAVSAEGAPPLDRYAEASERLQSVFDASELFDAVDRLLDEWANDARRGSAEAGARSEVRQGVEYVHRHYDQDIHLHDVARRVNLSPSWFAALFRAEIGKPFNEYVQRYRLERAKRLLRESDLKVYEVAESVGIANARYFSRLFYDAYGVTPLEYKKGGGG
ncbi:response regulator [Paenibacillus antri]|uniref:Response regulator n=1 Tax=Paenibacillus antri TaxID=2582848 RepID=A0A5R9GDR6_9BACL|nr:response regulator [Paenibacillus antri]TLS53249.1 response regulator [Paenibacillus antri]